MKRLSLIALLMSVFSVTGLAHAAPVISVKARTTIELDPVVRTATGIEVSGRITDNVNHEPVSWIRIRVRIDSETQTTQSAENGRFSLTLPVSTGPHELELSYEGDRHYAPTRRVLRDFDVDKRPLTMAVRAPARVTSGDAAKSFELVITSTSSGRPAPVPFTIAFGDAVGQNGSPAELTVKRGLHTDADGRMTVALEAGELGPPGRKLLEARFAGSMAYDAATARTTLLVTTNSTLTIRLASERIGFDDRIRATGRLVNERDTGIGGAPIALVWEKGTLAEGLTRPDGTYAISASAGKLGPGDFKVQTVFQPTKAWREMSRSSFAEVNVGQPRSLPVGYTLTAFGATAVALLAFVSLRTRPWRRWSKRDAAPNQRRHTAAEHLDGPVTAGLRPAKAGLVSTLRRAQQLSISVTVVDAVTGRAVPAAVTLRPQAGDAQSAHTDPEGRLALALRQGKWALTIIAAGYVTERFSIDLPHRGELDGARIDILPVRERIFSLYKEAAGHLLPNPELWGIWTPQQILDFVRAQRPAEALRALTSFVQTSYFSPRTVHEDVLPQAQALLAEAVRETDAARR